MRSTTFSKHHRKQEDNFNRVAMRYENLEHSFHQKGGLRDKYAGAMQEFVGAGDI